MSSTTTIRIFTSNKNTTNHKLIKEAIKQLSTEGYAKVTTDEEITAGQSTEPLLLIDGDEQQLSLQKLTAHGIIPDFHLIVSQLGLETDTKYSNDDLTLLIDGIKAVCSVSDGPTPQFNCPCC